MQQTDLANQAFMDFLIHMDIFNNIQRHSITLSATNFAATVSEMCPHTFGHTAHYAKP